MDSNKIFQVMSLLRDKVEPEQNYFISEKLKKTDDKAYEELLMLPYKNTIAILLLGWFLGIFGANRLYIGDKKIGVTKLILGIFIIISMIVFYILFIASIVVGNASNVDITWIFITFLWIWCILVIAYAIYCLVDIFLCVKANRKKTFDMIMNTLNKYPLASEDKMTSTDSSQIFGD